MVCEALSNYLNNIVDRVQTMDMDHLYDELSEMEDVLGDTFPLPDRKTFYSIFPTINMTVMVSEEGTRLYDVLKKMGREVEKEGH